MTSPGPLATAALVALLSGGCEEIIHDFGNQGLETTILAVDERAPAPGEYVFDVDAEGARATLTVRLDSQLPTCRRVDPPCRASVPAGDRALVLALEQDPNGRPALWAWFESADGDFLAGPTVAAVRVSRDGRFRGGYRLTPTYRNAGVRGDAHQVASATLIVD